MSRKLSTLEFTVLGYAWLRGPCTTYAIMKEISQSESSYHNSRAGTAYSIAKRLVGFGLLDSSADGEISISPTGVEALQEWLRPPLPAADIAHSADLVRLRFFFLGALDQESRLEFIDRSIEGLREFLQRCEALLPKNEELGDYFGLLATISTIFETKARIQWLTLVRQLVLDPINDQDNWTETILDRFPELQS